MRPHFPPRSLTPLHISSFVCSCTDSSSPAVAVIPLFDIHDVILNTFLVYSTTSNYGEFDYFVPFSIRQ